MKKRKFREKEFSTETLIDVNYDPEDVRDYDSGKAPVSRNTQHAEELEDMVELQKHSQNRDQMYETHHYSVLNAVRDYDHDAGRITDEPDEDGPLDDPDYTDAEERDDYFGGEFDVTDEEYIEPDDYDADRTDIKELIDIDGEISDEYEPRPIRPEDAGYEDIMEQFTAAPTKPKYWFEEHGDYWTCSCGHLNKGDYCTNCGLTRDLLRQLFVLHKPGDEPGEYEGMPIKYEEVIIPKGRLSTKQKLIIAIAIIAIMLAVGGFFTYYYLIVPAMEKEEAATIKATTETVQAAVTDVSAETDGFLWNSYISAGDNCLESKKYTTAISYYAKAQQINSTAELKDKIFEAKYQYVQANKDEGGDTFEKYLGELMAANYKETESIYNEYYAWHFNVVTNMDQDDYDTDLDQASRADTIFFHVSVSGGPPDGKINVYYEAVWPSGAKQTDLIGSNWSDGSKGYAKFSYPVPMLGKEGTLKFNIYDRSTQELLGSDSIKIKK